MLPHPAMPVLLCLTCLIPGPPTGGAPQPVQELRPVPPLLCEDLQTGQRRDSDSGSCRLGERQILPDAPDSSTAEAPSEEKPEAAPPPKRPKPRPDPCARATAAAQARLGPALRAQTAPPAEDSGEAGWSLRHTAVFRRSLTLADGRITLTLRSSRRWLSRKDALFNDHQREERDSFSAELRHLGPSPAVRPAGLPDWPGWPRLALTCGGGAACWTRRHERTEITQSETSAPQQQRTEERSALSEAEIPAADIQAAQALADALAPLIAACAARR